MPTNFAFCYRFGAILMPSVNPSIWAYQKRRRNEVSFSSQLCMIWFECFCIELLSISLLRSVNFKGLDMFQFNTELVS